MKPVPIDTFQRDLSRSYKFSHFSILAAQTSTRQPWYFNVVTSHFNEAGTEDNKFKYPQYNWTSWQHIVFLSGDATLMHVGCMCSQQYSFVAGSAWLRPFSMIHMLYLIPYTWGSNVDMVTSNFDMVTCNPHHTLTTPLRFSPAPSFLPFSFVKGVVGMPQML